MLTVLSITSAIFIIIAIGFITVRRGVLAASSARGLGVFVVDYALPALLFKALVQHPMGQVISIDFFMAYALGSVSLLVLGVLFRCVIQGRGVQEAAILTMGITVSNSAFMGFPIAQQIFGETARANLAVYVSVENLVMLPVLITLAEVGNQSHAQGIVIVQAIIKRLLTNPLILSISAGVLFSIFDWTLPVFLSRAFEMLSAASAPVALFYIGCILAGLRLREIKADISSVIFGKLVLHPLAVYLAFSVLTFQNPLLKQAAMINASMPMFSIYPLLNQKYGYENFCTAAMVLTTILSFFSITLLLWIIQSGYLI